MFASTFAFANNNVKTDSYQDVVSIAQFNKNEIGKSIENESDEISNLNVNQDKQESLTASCMLIGYAEFADGTVVEVELGVVEGVSCAQFYAIIDALVKSFM